MDWHEEAEVRRQERFIRRIERREMAEIAKRQRIDDICSASLFVAALVALYAFVWFGCLWASI